MYGRQMEINCFRWTKGNAKEIVRKRLRKCGGSGKDLKGCLRGPKRNAKEMYLKESQRISKHTEAFFIYKDLSLVRPPPFPPPALTLTALTGFSQEMPKNVNPTSRRATFSEGETKKNPKT